MLRRHADLSKLPLNFDPRQHDMSRPEDGWHVDDYRQPLFTEPPGPPTPGGSWETASRLVRDYAYADPAIIREVHRSGPPEPGQDMLLQGRFYGLRFYLGLRIGNVVDGYIERNGRQARVYGWNYRTLKGHLERGQMDQEVRKWLDTGEVEFHIHVFSQRGTIANPIIRLGFILFGRVTQVRFYGRACRLHEETDKGRTRHPNGRPRTRNLTCANLVRRSVVGVDAPEHTVKVVGERFGGGDNVARPGIDPAVASRAVTSAGPAPPGPRPSLNGAGSADGVGDVVGVAGVGDGRRADRCGLVDHTSTRPCGPSHVNRARSRCSSLGSGLSCSSAPTRRAHRQGRTIH